MSNQIGQIIVNNAGNSNVTSKENICNVKNAGNSNVIVSSKNKSNVSNAGNCNVNESEPNSNMDSSCNDNSSANYCDSAVPLDGTPLVLPVLLFHLLLILSCLRLWICASRQFRTSPQTMRLRASPFLLPRHLALLGCKVLAGEGPKRVSFSFSFSLHS